MPEKILKIIEEELKEVKEKYADPRRTKVYKQKLGEYSDEDLIANEPCLITLTKTGYIKRLPLGTYKSQRRGGKGITGMTTKEEDEVDKIITSKTHDNLLIFTDKGKVFSIRTWEINESSRISKGQAIVNLINIDQGEQIQSILSLPTNKEEMEYKYLIMATRKGLIKKTSLKNFDRIRSSGLIALKLTAGDELCWVKPSKGDDHVILITNQGKSIRFKETDARPMGRDTQGVRGILLKNNDYVVDVEVFPQSVAQPEDKRLKIFRDILVITEKGLGKRTDIAQYPVQKRGGMGVKAAHVTQKTGNICMAQLVDQNIDEAVITSKKGQVIKLPLKNIPRLKRDTQGVILMRFSKALDCVACSTCLVKNEAAEEKN